MRNQLIAIVGGALACLAFGMTRAFGYGLPPYSFVYAVALGIVAGVVTYGGLVAYGELTTKIRRMLWAITIAIGVVIVLGFGAVTYNNYAAAERQTAQATAVAIERQATVAPAQATAARANILRTPGNP